MKVTFVSNYINHHQIPLSNVLYRELGRDYTFIQTEKMEEERVRLGWGLEDLPEYVKCSYAEPQLCATLVSDSDIVIWGGAEEESMLLPRLQAGKPVIRYCERLYKEGQWKAISPRGLHRKYLDHTRYRDAQVYLLCAGAFVASDFHIVRAYPDKMFKWGYFPEHKVYDVEKLLQSKHPEEILWAARFIDWKHPELVVAVAQKLKDRGKQFHITMVGEGPMRPQIEEMIEQAGLKEKFSLTGAISPKEVRGYMEKASIFLMTSDRREGWGAVLNEAMNSGCVVISDRMEGASLFLIEQGENGYWCHKPTANGMAELVIKLLEDRPLRDKLGRRAYETITDTWNAEVAGKRLLKMCEAILNGEVPAGLWTDGPGSKAEIISERLKNEKWIGMEK